MKPGRKGEVIPVHEDEYATIIAYTLASSEYHEALQMHIREENDGFDLGGDPGDMTYEQQSHLPFNQKGDEDTEVIFGDVATQDHDDYFGGYRKQGEIRPNKDGGRSDNVEMPLTVDVSESRKLPPGLPLLIIL